MQGPHRGYTSLHRAPKGLHKPALLEVYFPQDAATTLQLVFDSQPTNRAGMNGLGDCSQILDASTVEQLLVMW